MEKVKFGVIGLGNIANTFCSDLVKSDKAKLYAVASRSIEKAQHFGEKYGAEKFYGSYAELISDDEVDIIYVATPHTSHKDISVMCMNAGKNVLCEKPCSINEIQMQKIINCAKKNNVFFMEGMWTRCFPLSLELKKIVKNNVLGSVRHIEANFGFGSWEDDNESNENNRLFSPRLAGGALLDLGIYPVAFAACLKGKNPSNIAAVANKTSLGVDGNTAAVFEYDDKCTAMIQCSICVSTSLDACIYFDNGKIELERFISPNNLKITHADGKVETMSDDFEKRGFNGLIYEIDHVADCINKGLKSSPYHSLDDTMDIVKTMDTIRRRIGLVYPFE